MSAPERPPIFADAIGGNWAMTPGEAIPWFIDNFLSAADRFPHWRIEDREISIGVKRLGSGRITVEAGNGHGEIALSADPSGWLLAVVMLDGAEMCRFYVERPYEDYELWPPGAGLADGEAPGAIGKRATWISLRAESWPILAGLAGPGGWVNCTVDETRLGETQ